MNQERLEELNKEVQESVQQYANGMITIVELTEFMAHMRRRIGNNTDLSGLLDPNTGLRFPTKEEMRETDKLLSSGEARTVEFSVEVDDDFNDEDEPEPNDFNADGSIRGCGHKGCGCSN